MLGSRLISFLKRNPSSQLSSSAVEDPRPRLGVGGWCVCGALIVITGGVALSALDDLAIYYGCSGCNLPIVLNHLELFESEL